MPLPLIPRPDADEWFGHWLLRIAGWYGMSLAVFLDRLDLYPVGSRTVGWVKAFRWTEDQWSCFANEAHVRMEDARAMQLITIPIARQGQFGFCPRCVGEGSGDRPIWRRSWMDAMTTWCPQHEAPIVICRDMSDLAYRGSSRLAEALLERPLTSRTEPPLWLQELARDGNTIVDHLAHGPTLVASLIEHVLRRVLRVAEDYDDAAALARLLGANSAEGLAMPLIPRRMKRSVVPVLGQIRMLDHRVWLLGAAARIIGPISASACGSSNLTATRDTLRSWLWMRLEVWELLHLVEIVRQATHAGLMTPWPEAQHWQPPQTGAAWFQRVGASP